MRIGLYVDNTVPVALQPLCEVLTGVCRVLTFEVGTSRFHISTRSIEHPTTFKQLPAALAAEARTFDLAVLCTAVPYENNFFFEEQESIVILSFSGWHLLTALPISNGIAYFVASMVADEAGIGSTHEENTGCVNDFWWDKRGVDVGMRAAFICPACAGDYTGDRGVLEDVRSLLDLVSTASRLDRDIVGSAVTPVRATTFDVFLCHSSGDKPAVRDINARLQRAGVRTWLDVERLPLGTPWQSELEKEISRIAAAAVFVGQNGVGPWQSAEIRAFLSEFADRGCPVIPVLLPGTSDVPQLPLFLRQMTWLDLRHDIDQGIARLAEVVKGRRQAGVA